MQRFNHLKYVIKHFLLLSRLLGLPSAVKVSATKVFSGKRGNGLACIQPLGFPNALWVRTKGSDLEIIFQIFLKRDYDLSTFAPYQSHIFETCNRICKEGNVPLIIDAGANIGASTLWFAVNFPDCQVYAIEPDPGNFDTLKRNAESHARVRLFHAGLWDRPTSLAVTDECDLSWGRRFEEKPGSTLGIPSITIPELLAANRRLRPVIIKIDIEGAEVNLMRSNNNWVDDVPLMIFEAHDNLWHWLGTWKGSSHAFFSTLVRQKREYLTRGENVFAFLHPERVEQQETRRLASIQ